MAQTVNIAERARLQEFGYRYRRSRISVTHTQFRGGTITVDNLATIARELQIDQQVLAKEFNKRVKKELGVNGPNYPGHITAEQLDQVLQKIIERSVLCPKCRLPEWSGKQCSACGHAK